MSVITDLIPTTLPTYHEKYRVGGYNRLGKLCYASILRRTEVSEGSWPIEVSGAGASPVTISTSYADKDFFSPVSGSSCKISMVAESYSQLLELGRGDDTMWKVEVVDDGDTIFRGFLKPETIPMEYGYEKPVVNVDATDGLGLLREMTFPLDGDSPFTGEYPVREVIAYILYRAGNMSYWYDHITWRPTEDAHNFTEAQVISVFDYHGQDIYSVLKDILKIIEAQVVSYEGSYALRLIDEPRSGYATRISYRGLLPTSIEMDNTRIELHDEYYGVSGNIKTERPINTVFFENKLSHKEQIIYNGDFSKTGQFSSPDAVGGWEPGPNNINATISPLGLGFYKEHEQDNTGGVGNPYPPRPIWLTHYFKTSFDRGANRYGGGFITIKFKSLLLNPLPSNKYFVAVCLGDVDNEDHWHAAEAEGTGWVDVEITLAFGDRSRVIAIGQAMEYVWPASLSAVIFKRSQVTDVEVSVAASSQGGTPASILTKDEYVVNENSLANKNIEIKIGSNNPYTYENAIWDKLYYSRDAGSVTSLYKLIVARYSSFYGVSRKRMSVEMYCKTDSPRLLPYSILFDKYLERNFVIMSSAYDVLRAKYSLELMEYERASTPPLTWILADGTWNDEGYWVDAENWNDGV